MSSIVAALAEALESVQRPGSFSTGGLCDLLAPGPEVEGVGPVALPLLPAQAVQLIAAAKRAPRKTSMPWRRSREAAGDGVASGTAGAKTVVLPQSISSSSRASAS